MFFPLRTDRPQRHRPWMNYTLIAANAAVFVLQLMGQREGRALGWEAPFLLYPTDPAWYQFFSYQFLHGGPSHLFGNMLFLYVFGGNLEDRLGPIGYLGFYLSGGVIAGVGHCLVESSPVLGASGSVSAVTGAYLALFPYTRITILVFFFIITFIEVPSIYLILLSFAWDVVSQFIGGGGVAYLAHVSGNVFGFSIGMGLLATRLLPREPYDLMALLDRWNRRRQLRALTRSGRSPWERDPGRAAAAGEAQESDRRIMEARAEVSRALQTPDPAAAVAAYERLLEQDDGQVMHRQAQLDVANHAMHGGRHATAARAYELFLKTYPRDEAADEVRLILGLLYQRYLDDVRRARDHLAAAAERLTDPARRQMARDMLAELERE